MIEYADERYYRWLDSIQRMNMIYEAEMDELKANEQEKKEEDESNGKNN